MRSRIIIGLSLLVCWSPWTSASSDLEIEKLKRVVSELEIITEMVDETELLQQPGDMTPFQYRPLKRDISLIIDGINAHIDEQYDTTYKRVPLFAESDGVYK